MQYPISEIFTSFQGEGLWAGTSMTFIRLAGCNVGRPYPKEKYDGVLDPFQDRNVILPVYNSYVEECTLYDGRKFPCDTNYRVTERLTVSEIIECIPYNIKHICVTGGEPLIHDLEPLFDRISCMIHIETSGTKPCPAYLDDKERSLLPIWVTVAPKWQALDSMICRADEFKFLVDENFDPDYKLEFPDNYNHTATPRSLTAMAPVFLHPVNFEHEIHAGNMKLCVDLQRAYPEFRIGPQLHKAISHYIKETIR